MDILKWCTFRYLHQNLEADCLELRIPENENETGYGIMSLALQFLACLLLNGFRSLNRNNSVNTMCALFLLSVLSKSDDERIRFCRFAVCLLELGEVIVTI